MNQIVHLIVSIILTRLYSRGENGEELNPSKIHACWELAARYPAPLKGKREKMDTHKKNRVMAWLVTLFIAIDRERVSSFPHREPHGSRIAWFARRDGDRLARAIAARETEGHEDNEVLVSHYGSLSQAIERGDADGRIALLASDSVGFQVGTPQEWRLAERYIPIRMASKEELISDGMRDSNGRLTHGGADGWFRGEVGPWSYEFETDSGEIVSLGYEGMSDTTEDIPLPWEAVSAGFVAETEAERAALKRRLSDIRSERAERFVAAFEYAVECPDPVRAYKTLWLRYRAAHLHINRGLDALRACEPEDETPKEYYKLRVAQEDCALWVHVRYTRAQFNVLQHTLAQRAGMGKRMKDGRPEIARLRPRMWEVKKYAGIK